MRIRKRREEFFIQTDAFPDMLSRAFNGLPNLRTAILGNESLIDRPWATRFLGAQLIHAYSDRTQWLPEDMFHWGKDNIYIPVVRAVVKHRDKYKEGITEFIRNNESQNMANLRNVLRHQA